MDWSVTAVSSEGVQQWYTKSRVLYWICGQGDVSECFVLPFQDAIPRASPYDFSDNPASSFDLHTTSVRSGFRPFIMLIRWRFLPYRASSVRCARCFSFREVTLQSCFLFHRIWLVSTVGVSLSSKFHPLFFILPCYAGASASESFIPSLPSSRLIYLSCTASNFLFFL